MQGGDYQQFDDMPVTDDAESSLYSEVDMQAFYQNQQVAIDNGPRNELKR